MDVARNTTEKNFSAYERMICGFSKNRQNSELNYICVCFANGALVIATLMLNGTSILTISSRSELKRKAFYFLILLQSTADVFAGFVSGPVLTAYLFSTYILGETNTTLCTLNFTLALLPMGLSLMMLCVMSFERYVTFLRPLSKPFNKNLLSVFFASVALAELTILPGSAMISYNYFIALLYVVLFTLVALIILLQGHMFLTIAREQRSSRKCSNEETNEPKIRKKRFLQELKLAKGCLGLACTFGMCYLPWLMLLVFAKQIDLATYQVLWAWCSTFAQTNPVLNSFVFFWSKPLLRKQASQVVGEILSSTYSLWYMSLMKSPCSLEGISQLSCRRFSPDTPVSSHQQR